MEKKIKTAKPEAIFIDGMFSKTTWNKPIEYYKEHCSYKAAFQAAKKKYKQNKE